MPAVILEGLAAGARIVATAVGGIPDVIQHLENGWLCRPNDTDDLTEKILAAIDDPRSSAIPENAVRTARQFDWPVVAETYMRVFEELLNEDAP